MSRSSRQGCPLKKSEIIPLTNFDHTEHQQTTPFKWLQNIKYLGIIIDNDLKNLYKLNYLPLLSKIEEDLNRWRNLPITLIGRIICVKMNILPRLQYLFQSLPVPFPETFFKTLNKHVRQFLWNGKISRVSMEKLTWDYSLGGWIQIGLHPLKDGASSDFIYKWNSKTISNRTDNPILKHFIKIWHEVQKNLGLNLRLSPKTPVRQN